MIQDEKQIKLKSINMIEKKESIINKQKQYE
jgi:hypothetical protein